MTFKENDKRFSLQICGYQFPQRQSTPDEYDYDANWLNCKIGFSEGDYEASCIDPCLTTVELSMLVDALSSIINGDKTAFVSDFLEPYLEIGIERMGDRIKFAVQFECDSGEEEKYWSVISLVGVGEAAAILNELKNDLRMYPER